jgi:hypothetical protein
VHLIIASRLLDKRCIYFLLYLHYRGREAEKKHRHAKQKWTYVFLVESGRDEESRRSLENPDAPCLEICRELTSHLRAGFTAGVRLECESAIISVPV